MGDRRLALGVDAGSVTLKLALLDHDNTILYSSYEKHYGHPLRTLQSALARLIEDCSVDLVKWSAVTGSARDLICEVLNIATVNEIVAQAVASVHGIPGVQTILEIGGQDSKFIELGASDSPGEAVIVTQRMNDICAAGTGAFIEQQAERLGIALEDFGETALKSDNPATVAARCAVFSKTDIVHLTQEGVPIADIAAGICRAVVRNYIAQFSKGKKFKTPIAFQGGLAANQGMVRAFRDVLEVVEDEFIVPEHFGVMGAIGTALLARDNGSKEALSLNEVAEKLEAEKTKSEISGGKMSILPKLERSTKRKSVFPVCQAEQGEEVFVGIDAGSTSTCIAVLGRGGRLIAESYTLNRGSLVESVDAALFNTKKTLEVRRADVHVVGVGATGSGRSLISGYVGADVIRDEISAQAKAAVEMMPDVDTVIEIGGQDSKYIRISDGRVVEFEMNRICAAGTGSFLQEQSVRLGEDMRVLDQLAFKSSSPADMGSRCTVFMESDLINYQQRGVSKEDLAAGLSYSLAKNYLEKVAAGKPIGEKILVLGGFAFNESAIAAFQQLLGKKVVVPNHHGISAAIGAALIAEEELAAKTSHKTKFIGFEHDQKKYEISSFQCADCSNACRVNKVATTDQTFYYNGVCGKYEQKKRCKDLPDLFKKREELLLSYLKPSDHGSAEKIGIPRAQLFYEFFPLWCVFLQELGFEVIVSKRTNKEIMGKGLERTCIDNCFASKMVYGHVADLSDQGVKRLFFPSVVEFERKVKDLERNYSCPHVQAMPSLIDTAFSDVEVISPAFVRDKEDCDWQKELKKLGHSLGKEEKAIEQAVRQAARAQAEFQEMCQQLGEQCLEEVEEEQVVCVIMGKVYNVCDPALNLNLAKKFLDLDVLPIPYDCLPLSRQELPINYMDMVWSSGQDLIRVSKIIVEDKRLYPVLVTNFGCGPDSFAIKYLDEIFQEKSFLVLEVDEHSSGVGTITRIEAFLNNIRKGTASDFSALSSGFRPFVPSAGMKKFDRLLYLPIGFDSYRPIAAAFESIGIRTKFLPVHDEETRRLGRMHSSGTECLPYIMHAGDAVRMTQDPDFHPDKVGLFLPSSDLGCRVSLFTTSIRLILRDLGYPDIPVLAPRVSMDKDEALKYFGIKFAKNLVRGLLAVELLGRVLSEKRPYEKVAGTSDTVYRESVDQICAAVARGDFWETLRSILERFDRIELDRSQLRPVIGLVGDDYTRGNSFANNELIREVEALGGEVWNVPIWSSYLEFQMGMKPRKMWRRGRYLEFLSDTAKAAVGKADIHRISRLFTDRIQCFPDPSFSEMMAFGSQYLDEKSEPLTIMALSHINHLLSHKVDGLINLLGFQCMIHSIVSANMKPVCEQYGNIPVLTLFFDFQENVHQKNRLEAFMYQVAQYRKSKRKKCA